MTPTTWANCTYNGVPTLQCLEVVFQRILTASSAIVIIVLFIMFIVGAFSYMTSLGNPERIKKAQAVFRYALIGLFLFLGTFLLFKIIDVLFLGNKGILFRFSLGS